jgi:hypothetical protein
MSAPAGCPADARVCPDGSTVGRVAPDCGFPPCPTTTPTTTSTIMVSAGRTVSSLSLKTDRPLYHSRETMWINLTVESKEGGVADIYAHGIESRGRERLVIRTRETLQPGVNQLAIKYQTPPCTGCAGINPGGYEITTEVTVDGKTYRGKTMVEIQQ